MEWELAARYQNDAKWTPGNHVSGDISGYCYPRNGDGSTVYMNYVWFLENCNVSREGIFSTRPVGQKFPNSLGLYDMSGNVWEWSFTIDGNWFRMIRGGSWFDDLDCLRLGFVSSENPADTDCNLGFRIVRSR